MIEQVRAWAPVLLTTLLGLPVAALATAGLANRRRRAGLGRGRAWVTAGAEVGMIVGTLPWLWMILTPQPGPGGLELFPGPGLMRILTGEPAVAVVQIGGNLLVFAAFGFFAPLRWPVRLGTVTALAAAGSLTVETLQYVLPLGRVTSVDDVLLNTLGAALAALASRRWWCHRSRAAPGGGAGVGGGVVPGRDR